MPDEGLDETFTINDGGNMRTQVWHYPGRGECLICHSTTARGVLGFTTPQLNRDFNYGGIVDNQLRALNNVGYFNPPATNLNSLLSLASATDETVSLEFRVRSYLFVNCSQCHQPGGSGQGSMNARIWTPLSAAGLLDGALFNDGGDTNNRVVAPGSLAHSMLLSRISTRGPGQMPPLGSSVLDTQAIALVSRWITNDLPSYVSFAAWQSNYFGSTNAPDAISGADPDGDGALNRLEWLTGTIPTNSLDGWRTNVQRSNGTVAITYLRVANRGFEVQWTTNVTNRTWRFLDVPENRPTFSAIPTDVAVPDLMTNSPAKFYRVRVFEP